MAEQFDVTEFAIKKALALAGRETAEYHAQYGQDYPCGFAWVVIRGARGKVAAALKEFAGAKNNYGGGLVVYNPSRHMTQSMNAKELGARKFADEMRRAFPKLTFTVESRMD